MWSHIALSLKQGNPYLIIIMALGFIGFVVLMERLIMLNFVYNINFSKFLGDVKKAVNGQDFERAMTICKSASPTSLPQIGLKALEAADTDPTSVRGAIEEATIDFLPRIETRVSFAPAVATLVILVGVLGTIDSLWSAFNSIEILDTSEKQALLANGIAESLNPTAMGIMLSMVLLAFNQMVKGLAIRLSERVQYGVAVLTNLLAPSEMPTIMSVAAAGATSKLASATSTDNVAAEPSIPSTNTAEDANDSFDDASVEDIKDEEEII